MPEILRYAAFTDRPDHGNPAGLVLDARGLDVPTMQTIAKEVGFSETAFLVEREARPGAYDVRYFTPEVEVAFCGHATITAGVALAERGATGTLAFHTEAGPLVPVALEGDGREVPIRATLTSPITRVESVEAGALEAALAALGWSEAELDPALPPRVAFGGERHLVLAANTRERLADLDYDVPRLTALTRAQRWITLQLVWRERADRFHSRNLGPGVGILEDPATGAAAAALGGYLRALGRVDVPARVMILQGEDMGRPGQLEVLIGEGDVGVDVAGGAVAMAN